MVTMDSCPFLLSKNFELLCHLSPSKKSCGAIPCVKLDRLNRAFQRNELYVVRYFWLSLPSGKSEIQRKWVELIQEMSGQSWDKIQYAIGRLLTKECKNDEACSFKALIPPKRILTLRQRYLQTLANKRWREKNREKCVEYSKQYQKNHPEKMHELNHISYLRRKEIHDSKMEGDPEYREAFRAKERERYHKQKMRKQQPQPVVATS